LRASESLREVRGGGGLLGRSEAGALGESQRGISGARTRREGSFWGAGSAKV
jgi:hypothetical protein